MSLQSPQAGAFLCNSESIFSVEPPGVLQSPQAGAFLCNGAIASPDLRARGLAVPSSRGFSMQLIVVFFIGIYPFVGLQSPQAGAFLCNLAGVNRARCGRTSCSPLKPGLFYATLDLRAATYHGGLLQSPQAGAFLCNRHADRWLHSL